MTHLRAVEKQAWTALGYDDANSTFQDAWRDAREAMADLALYSGMVGQSLYSPGKVSRTRSTVALAHAGKVAEASARLGEALARAQSVYDRVDRSI